jgi:DNA repair protein RadC
MNGLEPNVRWFGKVSRRSCAFPLFIGQLPLAPNGPNQAPSVFPKKCLQNTLADKEEPLTVIEVLRTERYSKRCPDAVLGLEVMCLGQLNQPGVLSELFRQCDPVDRNIIDIVPLPTEVMDRTDGLKFSEVFLQLLDLNHAVTAYHTRQILIGQVRVPSVKLTMNNKNRVNGFKVISTGSLTASLVHPREVWRAALHLCAVAVVFVHNHPSGDPAPSPEDNEITRRLKETGDMLGIRVLDHVVLGDDGRFFSFSDRGLL